MNRGCTSTCRYNPEGPLRDDGCEGQKSHMRGSAIPGMATEGDDRHDYGVPDESRRNLVRWFVRPVWFVLGALAVVFIALRTLGLSVPPRYRYVPFLATLVVFGLPHGAVDHLVPSRLRDERPTLRAVAVVIVLYTFGVAVYAVAWFVAPTASFVFFILLTWLHWGQGDLHAALGLLGTRVDGAGRYVTLAARGALPMLVPLVAFPEVYREVADATIGVFDDRGAEAVAHVFTLESRAVVAAVVVALCVGSVVATLLSSGRWRTEAGELSLLVFYFSAVPPILAVGFYFALWHSTRHIGRLLALDPTARERVEEGDAVGALKKFAYDATPLTVGALVILVGLYFVAQPPLTLEGIFATYLVLLAVLTLPHFCVVSLMDWVQRVW